MNESLFSRIKNWWPQQAPVYNIEKTWEQNIALGPNFTAILPPIPQKPKEAWTDLLGFKVASPLGVAAGPLLDSQWIALAAKLRFDVLTYKTIRSYAQPAHPLPNVLYIDAPDQLAVGGETPTLHPLQQSPAFAEKIAITNSFGNPSMDPDYLQKDIDKARQSISEGQLLIVSVFGTGDTLQEVAADFAKTAKMAKESGAQVIEANLSCPNVSKGEGSLFADAEAVQTICTEIVKEIGDTPLIIKTGCYPSSEKMKECFTVAAQAGTRAICGINTISAKVTEKDGTPSLGHNRLTSGICGHPIRKESQRFISCARQIINDNALNMELIGVGGMMTPDHLDEALGLGANAVQVATAMMWDPFIAFKYHENNVIKTELIHDCN